MCDNSIPSLYLAAYCVISTFSVVQLVASADCAGALDVTDDLQHLLVTPTFLKLYISFPRFSIDYEILALRNSTFNLIGSYGVWSSAY